ncbi:MAG: hypothetical protein LUH47_01835 [Clostridiales bacterium]|nr:hypothetical protein [Clostridiales bacterium]
MNKKLPIYILVIYFIFVLIILAVQLAGHEKEEFVSVRFNERLDNAVVIYDESPIMLKSQQQTFINENNTSQTPIVEDGITYLPLSFYENGFNAITSYNEKKAQVTVKYNNKALVAEIDNTKAVLSDAERDRKTDLKFAPKLFDGECWLSVRTFADIFGFELFYDEGLIIISNMENIFDKETEGESIEKVKQLVYNLPAAGSYERIKELYTEEEPEESETEETDFRYLQKGTEEDLYIIYEDEYIYYIENGRVVKADNMPYGEHNKLCSLVLPTGFNGDKIKYTGDYVCVSGTKGDKAAFCLIDMSGNYGIIRKYVVMEGVPRDMLYSDGYFYFCSLSIPSEEVAYENGLVSVDYENMRYFPETDGGYILNVCGINPENLSEPAVISSFFGVNDSFTFCGSGIYVAETDKNRIVGDNEEPHTNVYKLDLNEGETSFQFKTRIEGTAELTAKDSPIFITQNSETAANVYILDSLLDVSASNTGLDMGFGRLVEGEERIFVLDSENITVLDSKTGEFLGKPNIPDEKTYLYSDNRIIGFTQIIPEETKEKSESSEESAEKTEINAEEETETIYPSIKMTMYDISDPSNTEIISEEIIENTDYSMFDELKIEMGSGVVILPVKIWQEGELHTGLYTYIESSYYGLRFQGEI